MGRNTIVIGIVMILRRLRRDLPVENLSWSLVQFGLNGLDLFVDDGGQVGAFGQYWRSSHWTLLCLSTSVGEAVKCGGCAGGGLDAAVEPSGEGALEPAADVPVRLALGGAFGYVGSGG